MNSYIDQANKKKMSSVLSIQSSTLLHIQSGCKHTVELRWLKLKGTVTRGSQEPV